MSRRLARQIAKEQKPNGAAANLPPAEEAMRLKALAYDTVAEIQARQRRINESDDAQAIQALQQRIQQINARLTELAGESAPAAVALPAQTQTVPAKAVETSG